MNASPLTDSDNTRKRTRRKVLVIPGDGDEEDFAIDQDDYVLLRGLLKPQEPGIYANLHKFIGTGWNDEEERRVYRLTFDRDQYFSPRFTQAAIEDIKKLSNLTELAVLNHRADDSCPPNSIALKDLNMEALKNLTRLNLSGTESRELIPSIGQLQKLQVLNLSHTKFYRFPEIGQLQKLEELDLTWANTRHLPNEIGNLISLKRLILSHSQINELPPTIGQLKNLERLFLDSTNCLSKLPEEIGNLVKLDRLYMRSCPWLKSLPSCVLRLPNLQHLFLGGSGPLSNFEDIGNMTNLKILSCKSLRISRIPPSIEKLRNLERLDLSEICELTELPEEFGNLTSLKVLSLSNASQLFELPPSIGKLQNLVNLNLRGCSTLLSLPPSIGRVQKLIHLYLKSSGVGRLPEEIKNLTGLITLELHDGRKSSVGACPKSVRAGMTET